MLSTQDLLRGVFRDRADVVNADDTEYSDAGSEDPFEEVIIGDNPFHATGDYWRQPVAWNGLSPIITSSKGSSEP